MLAKRDYYEILGVTRPATSQDISDAFEKLAAELKTAGKPSNIQDVERIREVVTAYRVPCAF
jgi:molecular chaperone DnaJ